MVSTRFVGNGPSYFYIMDVARGIAALAVVLWHWQHFFFKGALPVSFDRESQPLYDVFFLFYEKGWLAVDFFFILSGFIFFWLYYDSIRERKISAWKFFLLRFSRLYPLHLLTLLLVVFLQWVAIRLHGQAFVYPMNDVYHFFLNLFLVVAWGFQKGFSFNAPVWSVSVEVLLYALFFLLVWLLRLRFWHILLLAILGFWLQGYASLVGRGIFAFYMGGVVCFVFSAFNRRGIASRWIWGLTSICFVMWGVTLFHFRSGRAFNLFDFFLRDQGLITKVQWVELWTVGVLLPVSVLCMALFESRRLGGPIPGKWLGDISYSSYLLHFPLQLIFFILAHWLGFDDKIFYSSGVWFAYFLSLIFLSLAFHRFYERPVQRLIRRYFRVGR